MADAKLKTISLLQSTDSVNLNAAADTETTIYTVPTGKSCIIDHVVFHTFSADALITEVSIGVAAGTALEYIASILFTGVTASYATQAIVASVVPALATPTVSKVFTTGQIIVVEITTAAGSACTCTVEVWGHIF